MRTVVPKLDPRPAAAPIPRSRSKAIALVVGLLVIASAAPASAAGRPSVLATPSTDATRSASGWRAEPERIAEPASAADRTATNPTTGDEPPAAAAGQIRPTIQYEEAMAHAADRIDFRAGERVTVPFRPRSSDRWTVDGNRPSALPAGRLSGRAIRAERSGRGVDPAPGAPGSASGPIDVPYAGDGAIPAEPAAAVDPGGLRREVFGFLPYWELGDSSTTLDWEKLSTLAYFGVGAAANGDLQKKNGDGSTTVGWSGWTSSRMTNVINAAHASGARVVLTVQSFAWSSAGVKRQKALLGSPSARSNLARQIARAVRDRGADGVNLDFEPIVATYADEFTALVRSVRSELNKIHGGYQVTFDTTGWIGNYPLEDATGKGAADAVVIMGYDYRTSSSATAGSIAPIGGPLYDIRDTIAAYRNRLPASRIILGVPYYGRAWSTSSSSLNAKNISGTKNGASASVVYSTAVTFAAEHGRKWDPVEGVAWTVYRRQNCTTAYGCVKPWRQLYYDDKQALGAKYDLVNGYNLRGVGIWALGYDGSRPELYRVLKAKFITDTVPPKISGSSISSTILSPNGDGRLDTTTVRVSVTGHIAYGWDVQPWVDGSAGPSIRSGSVSGKAVAFTWDGRRNDGKVAPDGTYRITVWAADASDNRASVRKIVVVDRRAAAVSLSSSPTFVSPNGDGHADRTTITMRADEALTGRIRLFDADGHTIRRWSLAASTGRSVTWDGRDTAGRRLPDGRYTVRVRGLDRAGNRAIRDLSVAVDRTIKAVTWARSSFIPKSGQTDRLTFSLRRRATVTVGIYRGTTLVRKVWTDRRLGAGTYGWTWNGRTSGGTLFAPGTYRVVVKATSRIGTSAFSRKVVVLRP